MDIGPYLRHPVECQEYDPRAPQVARYVMDLIRAQLPGVSVEHIGSSAVPGCAGRGVIDLMLLYADRPSHPSNKESVELILEGLDRLGFQWVQRLNALPDEWPKGAGALLYQGSTFRVHLHVLPADHPAVAERRAFRDRLRADPRLLAAYVARKREIIAARITDPIAYTCAKAAFVEQVVGYQ